ncbi:MAG TPA: trypsin-like serine protease [Kofleriaceae bacterium]|nr:trypsin-like serine protease [Kofleriaceae bacterium]
MGSRRFTALLLVAGCAGPEVAERGAAITNGRPALGDPAVVALLSGGQLECTGTLIADDIVLTAAHCVGDGRPDQVLFGSSVDQPVRIESVASASPHPDFDPATLAHDLALVRLACPVDLAPVPVLDRAFDGSFAGRPIRVVGFGADGAGGAGIKREGVTAIESFGPDWFRFAPLPSQTCFGDSGGPALLGLGATELVVGVTSTGDIDCAAYGLDVRVDPYVAGFVAPYVAGEARGLDPECATDPVAGGCAAAPGAGGAAGLFPIALALAAARRARAIRFPAGKHTRR